MKHYITMSVSGFHVLEVEAPKGAEHDELMAAVLNIDAKLVKEYLEYDDMLEVSTNESQ